MKRISTKRTKRPKPESETISPKRGKATQTKRISLKEKTHKDSPILPIFVERLRDSNVVRKWKSEDFYSDRSRIVFCSSFRRMMKKAQVFSLESNTSVRNRLTRSLEVADIGRTLGRHAGKKLEEAGISNPEITQCMECIVENAGLLHDIGNPPFGHFGEQAIKQWFKSKEKEFLEKFHPQLELTESTDSPLEDFPKFDGNPQGFRIATKLHCDIDFFGLNLTASTLLTSIKYPPSETKFGEKLGVLSSEKRKYDDLCKKCGFTPGKRYFLACLMELADDVCYCLSDVADGFEKQIITSRDFKYEFRKICNTENVDSYDVIPGSVKTIKSFGYETAINIAQRVIEEAPNHFVENISKYIAGDADKLSSDLPSGKILKCFKAYARHFLYGDSEVQRIEIAGSKIVEGLLNNFGKLLDIPKNEFRHFSDQNELRKNSGSDVEWRIYNQLSKRMLKVCRESVKNANDETEWISRARLIVDYVSGLTDSYALEIYQNFTGIRIENRQS